MKKKCVWKILCCLLLMIAAALSCVTGVAGEETREREWMVMNRQNVRSAFPSAVRFAEETDLLSVAGMDPEALRDLTLIPGGMPFGVRFLTEGVTVVGFCDVEQDGGRKNPAAEAGIRLKDVILCVDGEPLTGAAQLTEKVEASAGKGMALRCRRGRSEFEVTVTPLYCPSESRYKTGIWVRDSGAGIGTVTFLLPETGAFAGLGHGICDADTGALISMRRGTVSDVTISSVVRGMAGSPGELKGYFNAGKVGTLLGNTVCGVWGVFFDPPESTEQPFPVGLRDEIAEGDAYILCTLDHNKTERYDIRISNINREATGPKCFTVTVTDPDLIAASGGIVQGMSGSPIIQDGKLVGAVTHVLINDPTVGYGIFLENMLAALPIPVR